MDDDDESVPGLHDPISVPREQRIARYETYLRDFVSFELAVHIAATNSILLKDIEDQLAELQEQMEPLRNIKEGIEEAFDAGRAGLEIGRKSTEKLMVVLREKIDRRNSLSKAGKRGATVRANKTTPLKNWAIQEAQKLKGKPSEQARNLMKKISPGLAALSNDPERVMRDAIRANKKIREAGLT